MIAPLAPTLPPLGAGAHCDASALQFFDNRVQVIQHNRNQGMPQRRGHSCMPPRASVLFKGFPMKIESIKYNKGLSVCFSVTMNAAALGGTPPRRIGN
jgi:hypothetical protein